jgi:Ca2+-binding RTX toxin-like protein
MRDHAGDTITITATENNDYTFDINNITVDTIDISNITTSTIHTTSPTITLDDTHWADEITWEKTEFEDCMPSVAKVEDMCNDYPALEKAYENFKMIYKMVHQDWKGKQDDETPF